MVDTHDALRLFVQSQNVEHGTLAVAAGIQSIHVQENLSHLSLSHGGNNASLNATLAVLPEGDGELSEPAL